MLGVGAAEGVRRALLGVRVGNREGDSDRLALADKDLLAVGVGPSVCASAQKRSSAIATRRTRRRDWEHMAR